jgi:hypothetical protein
MVKMTKSIQTAYSKCKYVNSHQIIAGNQVIWLFVLLPVKNFSLIFRHHHCQWRAANSDSCIALKPCACSSEGYFTCKKLSWHRTSVFMVKTKRPAILTSKWRASCEEPITTYFNALGLTRTKSKRGGVRTQDLQVTRRELLQLEVRWKLCV